MNERMKSCLEEKKNPHTHETSRKAYTETMKKKEGGAKRQRDAAAGGNDGANSSFCTEHRRISNNDRGSNFRISPTFF